MKVLVLVVLFLIALSKAEPINKTDSILEVDPKHDLNTSIVNDPKELKFLGLPSGIGSIIKDINTSFSCIGKKYGYYADMANGCQIYHVCDPKMESTGANGYQFSFLCANGTIFDQEKLSCISKVNAIDCKTSESFYNQTEKKFARLIDEPISKKLNQITEPSFVHLNIFIRPAQRLDVQKVEIKGQEKIKEPLVEVVQVRIKEKRHIKGGQHKVTVEQIESVNKPIVHQHKTDLDEEKSVKVQEKVEFAHDDVDEKAIPNIKIASIIKPNLSQLPQIEVHEKVEVAKVKDVEEKVNKFKFTSIFKPKFPKLPIKPFPQLPQLPIKPFPQLPQIPIKPFPQLPQIPIIPFPQLPEFPTKPCSNHEAKSAFHKNIKS